MKLVYFAPADIQLARVDRRCIVEFCSALAALGVEVELVALRIRVMASEPTPRDPLGLYAVRKRFTTRLVRVPVGQRAPGAWLAANRLVVHAAAALRHVLFPGVTGSLVFYTKTYSTAAVLLILRSIASAPVRVVFEVHLPPKNRLQRLVLRRADRVVANTSALAADLTQQGEVSGHRVIGVHQGVDSELIQGKRPSQAQVRAKLGLPEKTNLVVYTGKIYRGYREVDYLLAAARALEHKEDLLFVLVGGRADHVSHFRNRVAAEGRRNTLFVGFVPPAQARDYQRAADALVLYYPSGLELNRYRSPGKLFEYMASGRPILSVDLPVLTEVLGQPPAAALVPSDSPMTLAREISSLLEDRERAKHLSDRALRQVRAFTWEERARRVVAFIEGAESASRRSAEVHSASDRVA